VCVDLRGRSCMNDICVFSSCQTAFARGARIRSTLSDLSLSSSCCSLRQYFQTRLAQYDTTQSDSRNTASPSFAARNVSKVDNNARFPFPLKYTEAFKSESLMKINQQATCMYQYRLSIANSSPSLKPCRGSLGSWRSSSAFRRSRCRLKKRSNRV
jgi:hypothetical protein